LGGYAWEEEKEEEGDGYREQSNVQEELKDY